MKLNPLWITGFVDGGKCFKLEASPPCFTCRVDRRSADVAYAIKKFFGCGRVRPSGDSLEYVESNPQHLEKYLLPFFSRYPLLTEQRNSFLEFARGIYGGDASEMQPSEMQPSEMQPSEMQGSETSSRQPLATTPRPSPDWFRGMVDAQAHFSLERRGDTYHPVFLLPVGGDGALANDIHSLMRCGVRSPLEGFHPNAALEELKPGRVHLIRVSSLVDLEEKLFPFFETRGSKVLLRTIKRIAYQKFRRIVRIRLQGRGESERGGERHERLIVDLNKINNLSGDSSTQRWGAPPHL